MSVMNWQVMAISSSKEVPVYLAEDCLAACEMAMTRNVRPYSILYIVEAPDGSRMSIREQGAYFVDQAA
ncbi:MAG: hypothetical protein R3312_10390 [Gammaproteobacteria bacterium]|nr:hypothetical protein [Gammaproteobacteria bacterium]